MLKEYEGKRVFHGEAHEHAATGGTSDGRMTLAEWRTFREEKGLDFIAILDHRQVRHMYLPDYDEAHALCGTEPGTRITDADAEDGSMHYNMLFPRKGDLAELLAAFPEFEFTGGIEGHFTYPSFTKARFAELIAAVRAKGGLLVHPHPMQVMRADDCGAYAVTDRIALETIYGNHRSRETSENYALWLRLLSAGRRVWAAAGCDSHGNDPDTRALTSVYAAEGGSAGWLRELSVGNYACGPVGIQMTLAGGVMGSETAFSAGDELRIRLGDCYAPERGKAVSLTVLAGRADGTEEAVWRGGYLTGTVKELALSAEACRYYRVELWEDGCVYALGNPIWNR